MADRDPFIQPAIPRFDGHYDHWSMLMENILKSKEIWSVVESGVSEPATEAALKALTNDQTSALNSQRLKDLKAKNYLFQSIDRSILETILVKETSKQIWDSMKSKYKGTARVKRAQLQALRTEFETLCMQPGESVSDYFSRTMRIANKMRINGDKMKDTTIMEKILRSMTANFDYVVCSMEESKDLDELSIDELQSSLLVHEQRINRHVSVEHALQLQSSINNSPHTKNGSGRGRNSYIQSGGRSSYGRGRGRGNYQEVAPTSRPFDKTKVRCYRCNRLSNTRDGGEMGIGDENRGLVWPKLYITLTSKEKEEDFMAMKGCKPPHRPKKRAKVIQRTLLLVSPGAWLSDMCQERYEVREKKSSKKRPRGLKAMGSMESDSE